MAEERSNGTPKSEFNDKNTIDIQHRLPAPGYIEETSTEIAAPVNSKVVVTEKTTPVYREETAAELTAPLSLNRDVIRNRDSKDQVQDETEAGGKGIGFTALALSIISLFVLPILFGAVGIILGFVARRKGAESLGSWAIGIGAIAIIVGIFILPFF